MAIASANLMKLYPEPLNSTVECLSLFELLSQNTMDWEAYKQQSFSHSSRGWKFKIKVAADLVSGEAYFQDHRWHLFTVS
jgi:hypothetical protein